MRADEVSEVFNALSKLDLKSMDVVDQMAYILAANQFAERMKPLNRQIR